MQQGPTTTANKAAMAKALGAAFLSHQVEQLEKSVNGRGQEGNWRDRRYRPGQERAGNMNMARRAQNGGEQRFARARGGAADRMGMETGAAGETRERVRREDMPAPRGREKDADVVVVDASVLVHALWQVKKWCRDGRQEIVIIPLEGASHT